MIKIIKQGTQAKVEKFYNKTCRVCKCEFEFTADDAKMTQYARDGGQKILEIFCPECNAFCCQPA